MSTLSVIMANYNHVHFVGGALRAILTQSRQPDEIIVIDDGSTDDSVEVLREFETKHSIVSLYRNKENRGAVFTANRALALASSDYVYSAAADDRVGPGLFEKSMKMLEAHPDAGLCCSDPATFDHTGFISMDERQFSDRPCYLSPDSLTTVLKGGFIAGHTSIVKRSAMVEMGGFRPELMWVCDWFLWLAIGFRYGVCYLPEPLAAFRRNPYSFSAVGERDREQQAKALTQVLALVKSPEYRDLLPRFIRSSAFCHFRQRIVDLVLGDPDQWDVDTLLLVLFPLHQWSTQIVVDRQKRRATMERLVPEAIAQCRRENVTRAVIYGAGSHTEQLLPLWREAAGPPVERILVTTPDVWEFMGLPVSRASDYRPMPGDGIVLSSAMFEVEMAATCERLWPNTPYIPLHHAGPARESTVEPMWESAVCEEAA